MVMGGLPVYAASRVDGGAAAAGEAQLLKQGRVTVIRGLHGRVPQLTDPEGKSWILQGEWVEELLRTDGLFIQVSGVKGDPNLLLPTIVVAHYQIVRVGTKRPRVGILLEDENKTLWLREKDELRELVARKGVRSALGNYLNCKIWLVGAAENGKYRVTRFGWLNCKKKPVVLKKEKSK